MLLYSSYPINSCVRTTQRSENILPTTEVPLWWYERCGISPAWPCKATTCTLYFIEYVTFAGENQKGHEPPGRATHLFRLGGNRSDRYFTVPIINKYPKAISYVYALYFKYSEWIKFVRVPNKQSTHDTSTCLPIQGAQLVLDPGVGRGVTRTRWHGRVACTTGPRVILSCSSTATCMWSYSINSSKSSGSTVVIVRTPKTGVFPNAFVNAVLWKALSLTIPLCVSREFRGEHPEFNSIYYYITQRSPSVSNTR